jgi:uncharacterized oxidoreductase
MPVLPAEDLRAHLIDVLTRYRAGEAAAAEVADHLIEANLAGHDSHGVMRAPWYIEKIEAGELIPGAPLEILNETPTTAIVDGHWGFGQPASRRAIDLAIAKAEAAGIACVTVRRANHMGRVGYYTGRASAAGLIGLGCVNLHGASPCVAPFGGIDRRLPTNPFSVAYPADRAPDFLLDMTSSIVAEGKLQLRRNRGLPADEGWIIDHAGQATADPWAFYDEPCGALLPLGGPVGHKGFALAMAIEGLAGGLSGAGCSRPDAARHGNACWYAAIRIAAFTPLDEFRRDVGRLIDHVKSSRRAEGVAEILYPGEPERRMRDKRLADGVPIDPHTWEWLGVKAAKVGARYAGALGPGPA